MTKAGDFDQGEAGEGPEDIALRKQEELGGDDSVRGNVKNPSTGRAAGNLGVQ